MRQLKIVNIIMAAVMVLTIVVGCAAPTPQVVEKIVKETVVVEKEKQVQQTVIVEKEKIVEKQVVVTPTAVPPTPKPTLKSGEVAREDTLIFDSAGRAVDPQNFNRLAPTGFAGGLGYIQSCLEPLWLLNYETGQFMPWLGEKYEVSNDLKEWTFYLRKNVTWSDGKPFTAEDVAFTIDLLVKQAPKLASSAAMAEWVDKVQKVDDFTVKIFLKKPNPRFLLDYFGSKIGSPAVHPMPAHVYKDVADVATFKFYDPAKGWPLGTGPYKLVSTSETQMVWDRRDDWWGAKTGVFKLPQPKRLIWLWNGTEEQRAAAVVNNLVDYAEDVSPGALIAMMQKNSKIRAWYAKEPYAWLDPCARDIEINCLVKPWDDKEMRWALNYLIDRKEIVNVAYEGSTSISFTPFPYYTPLKKLVEANLSDMAAKVTTYDPKLAYAIFEKKGYKRNKANFWEKDGKVLSITLQAHAAYVEMKKIPMVVVEQWQRGGVDAVLRVLEGTNWSENLNNGTFEASCGWQSCGSVNEPWASLEQYNIKYFKPIGERASTNYWRWSNQPFSDLVDKIGTLPLESPEIIPLFKQAMTILYDEMPVIYVTQARKILPQNSTYWTNWPTADNPYSHPPSWWPIVHFILQNVQKAK